MKTISIFLLFASFAYAQGQVCRVSNAQINGYVLTATSTGGNLCAWQAPTGGGGGGAVTSVFGRIGAVVANTGDYAVAQVTGAAPLASPTFTGIPTAPTASPGTNTTQLATTAFVTTAVGGGGCPTCLLGTPSNHGVVLSSATQTTHITGAGITGQPFLSGGGSADGGYGTLNLAGGTSIITGVLPALNLPTASSSTKGIIQGDGSTITITSGVMACTTATTSQIGCLKPDGTTISISGGVISVSGGASPVTSVFGRTGAVVATNGDYSVGQVTGAAPLASPTFTGVPISTTPSPGDNSTKIATTAFVATAIAGIGTGVTSFNTRTGAVTAQTGDYSVGQVTGAAPLASPSLTGVPTGPTAAPGTNTTQLATTAFVTGAVGASPVTSVFGRTGAVIANTGDYTFSQVTGAAPLASPSFTGVPIAPTASPGTNTSQLATTAFVANAISGIGGATIAHTTNIIAGDGAGNGVNSGVGYGTLCGGCAASIDLPVGTPTGSIPANTVRIEGPASVSVPYAFHLPTADGEGFLHSNGLGQTSYIASPLPLIYGGNATATPTISGSSSISVTGSWGAYTISLVGGTTSGSGAANQVATWASSSLLTGSSTFTYASNVLTAPTVNTTTGYLLNSVALEPVYCCGGSNTMFANHVNNTTTATQGTAFGSNAGLGTSGQNTTFGFEAGAFLTTGTGNVLIGRTAGFPGIVTGINNVAVGVATAGADTSSCVFIGNAAGATGVISNCTAIGSGAVASASNHVVIGNSGVTDVYLGSEMGNATLHCANCAGGGFGVTSFNTRTGAVTLTNTDVNAVAPITLGNNTFTGSNPLQTLSGGGFDNTHDYSAHVSLLGSGATSQDAVLAYFHPVSENIFREAALVGASVSASTDSNWETDAVIAMAVAKNTLGFGAGGGNVALSGFGASAVSGGVIWAENLLVQDANKTLTTCTGQYQNWCHYPSTVIASEMDLNIFDTGSVVSGINLGITYLNGHTSTPTRAIAINTPGNNTNNHFDYGMILQDQSAVTAISIGELPSGIGANSQFVEWISGTSDHYIAQTYTTAFGYFVVQPDHQNNANRFLISPIGETLTEGNNAYVGPYAATMTGTVTGNTVGSMVATSLGFNTQNVSGTYKALTTGNRSAYLDMGNSGGELVITTGTQTAGSSLSGSTTVFSFSTSGVLSIPASSFIFNGHTCTIVSTVITCP